MNSRFTLGFDIRLVCFVVYLRTVILRYGLTCHALRRVSNLRSKKEPKGSFFYCRHPVARQDLVLGF